MPASLNPFNLAKSVVWRAAFALRESGQALERVGCRLQGIYSYEEVLSRHVTVTPTKYTMPSVGSAAYIAPSSLVLGNVKLGSASSVWYNAIIRGDQKPVVVGNNTNIQDNAVVGATSEFSPAVEIGDNVSIGHGAVLKGCKIGDNTLVGIAAVISEGVEVGSHSIIAAGSYIEENTVVPPGEVWAGSPAKKLRDVKPSEREYLQNLPQRYIDISKEHSEVLELINRKMEDYTR